MKASSMTQLENMLKKQLQNAMNEVSQKSLGIMKEKTAEFYSQGNPKIYRRTGTLGNTPRTTPLTSAGKSVSFEAYLDKGGGYATGTFSMGQVLESAENHMHGILGKPNFWANSEKEIGKEFNQTMKQFFG